MWLEFTHTGSDRSVILFSRNDTSDTTSRTDSISLSAWHQMYVGVKDVDLFDDLLPVP